MMDDTVTTQQVTSKVPSPQVVKNPKRVAAGKAIAEKRRQAREAQKQKMAEADIIIANERLKKAQEEAKKVDHGIPASGNTSGNTIGNTIGNARYGNARYGNAKRDSFTNFDNYTMADGHRHRRFNGGRLLQTRGDKKLFVQD